MNATQIGNAIKSMLIAAGVSGSFLGYISDDMWVAIGGFVLAVGAFIWQLVTHKTETLIKNVADSPLVAEVVVKSPATVSAVPSPKVVVRRAT